MRAWLAITVVMLGACKRSEPAVVVVPPARDAASSAVPDAGPRMVPDAGAACVREPDKDVVCVDAKNARACQRGVWVALACAGALGCAPGPKGDVCDQSISDPGATCDLDDDYGCATTHKEMVRCAGERWVSVQRCGGSRGCSVEGKRITCDNSVARVNDTCREEDDFSCTEDGAMALVCRQGKFITAGACRGPKKCRVSGAKETGFKVECDDSQARLGDVCSKEDHYSCAEDGRAILRCRGSAFVIDDRCKGKERCAIRSGQIGCY